MGIFSFQKQRAPSFDTAPLRKPYAIIHPDNVPETMASGTLPDDFIRYEYVGVTTETFSIEGRRGKSRRPGLVARMQLAISYDDASSTIEMTASLRDLFGLQAEDPTAAPNHPDAQRIANILREYYETKIGSEREAPRQILGITQGSTQIIRKTEPNAGATLFATLNSAY